MSLQVCHAQQHYFMVMILHYQSYSVGSKEGHAKGRLHTISQNWVFIPVLGSDMSVILSRTHNISLFITQAASWHRASLLLMYRCVGPAAKGPHLQSEDFHGSYSYCTSKCSKIWCQTGHPSPSVFWWYIGHGQYLVYSSKSSNFEESIIVFQVLRI